VDLRDKQNLGQTERICFTFLVPSQYDRRSLLWQKIVRIGRSQEDMALQAISRHNSSKVPQKKLKI
jgi:hypothetical protein